MIIGLPQPISLAELRASLAAFVALPNGNARAQVMVAILYLSLFEIPKDRHALRPFTDDWTPERHIRMKTNVRAYLDELERMDSAHRAAALASLGELGALATGSMFAYVDWPEREFKSYYTFLLERHDGGAYCQEVLAWLARSPSSALADLARFFINWATVNAFARILPAEARGEAPMVTGLRRLVSGAVMVQELTDPAALPALREAMTLLAPTG
jgi:hypothetical protein